MKMTSRGETYQHLTANDHLDQGNRQRKVKSLKQSPWQLNLFQHERRLLKYKHSKAKLIQRLLNPQRNHPKKEVHLETQCKLLMMKVTTLSVLSRMSGGT